RACQWMACLT
ncbi:carbamoyl-phosphate synthase L chain, ATP binding domain protein, partial [Vibrio parahaemolyticus EKP-028]